MKDLWHLEDTDCLGALDAAERAELRNVSQRRDFAPGELVFAPNPTPNAIYLLEQGLIRIYRLSEHGGELVLGYVSRGEIFGELSVFDHPRESFADAVRASVVWRIPREAFETVVSRRPALVIRVTRQIGSRFKHVESRVENLVFRDVATRLVNMLLELASDFGKPKEGGAMVIDLPLTQAELGKLIGTTRQSVNQSMRELEAEGLIGRQAGRIVLRRPEDLARLGRSSQGG